MKSCLRSRKFSRPGTTSSWSASFRGDTISIIRIGLSFTSPTLNRLQLRPHRVERDGGYARVLEPPLRGRDTIIVASDVHCSSTASAWRHCRNLSGRRVFWKAPGELVRGKDISTALQTWLEAELSPGG